MCLGAQQAAPESVTYSLASKWWFPKLGYFIWVLSYLTFGTPRILQIFKALVFNIYYCLLICRAVAGGLW